MGFNALDEYLDSLYEKENVPGCGIVIYVSGKKIHEYFTGYSDVDKKIPFTGNTVVDLYSLTKISTITAAMIMVENNLMSLDDPIERYLPYMKRLSVIGEDGKRTVLHTKPTIRHLMSMTAGFDYDVCHAEIQDLIARTNGDPTLRDFTITLSQIPLNFEPGTHFCYSFCIDILGSIMETIIGHSLSSILEQYIFSPLHMCDTAFSATDDMKTRMAVEYTNFNGKKQTYEKKAVLNGYVMDLGKKLESGGSGLLSTAYDYSILAATLANGGSTPSGYRLIKNKTIDLIREPQLSETSENDFLKMGNWSKAGYSYGLGVRTLKCPERNNSLSKTGEFGWDGARGCYMLADPEMKTGIVYVQQERGSHWSWYHGMIRNLAYVGLL